MTAQVFVSATGAKAGTERYFEEAIEAGFYGVDDDETFAFRWVGDKAAEVKVEHYDDKPWGEQQAQVDWLESRYDDQYESENDNYGDWDD